MVILEEPFCTLWKDKDPFEEVEKLSGDVKRSVETRRTLRFDIGGKGYYLKLHHGTEFSEVVKNLVRFRMPILGADREWNAIHRLAENGVDTMEGVAYGEQGTNPLNKTSFIITRELESTVHLRDYWIHYLKSPRVKRLLTKRVAEMVRGMHACGINHRDCYIVHFLIRLPFDGETGQEKDLKISLIDLHRAMIRDKVPQRWRNKDLIELLFSVREFDFGQRDIFRFMKIYFQKTLRNILRDETVLVRVAQKRLQGMLRHHEKKIRPEEIKEEIKAAKREQVINID